MKLFNFKLPKFTTLFIGFVASFIFMGYLIFEQSNNAALNIFSFILNLSLMILLYIKMLFALKDFVQYNFEKINIKLREKRKKIIFDKIGGASE